MSERWLLLVCLLLTACPRTDTPDSPDVGRLKIAFEDLPYHPVATLPLLTTATSAPAVHKDALRHWQTATTSFAAHDFEGAADAFMSAAEILQLEETHPHATTYDASRCLAYRGAASAWLANGAFSEAHQTLTAKQKADPSCKHSIALLLKHVPVELKEGN